MFAFILIIYNTHYSITIKKLNTISDVGKKGVTNGRV